MSSFLPWVSLVLIGTVIPNASTYYNNFSVPGMAAGTPCVFPFVFRGNSYSSCITLGNQTMWCSTTTNFDKDGQWKECLPYDICSSYYTLSDPWRNSGFKSTSFPGWPRNDHHIQEGWYRFTGIGGDVLNNLCATNCSGSNMTLSLGMCRGPSISSSDGYRDSCDVQFNLTVKKSGYSSRCDFAAFYLQRINCRGFYLYYLTPVNGVFSTRHHFCTSSSCGPNAHCNSTDGSCTCDSGFSIPDHFLPTGDSYGCSGLKITVPDACKVTATLDKQNCTNNLLSMINNITTEVLPPTEVTKALEILITPQNTPVEETSQEERISSFNVILRASEKVVSTLVQKTETNYSVDISLQTTEVRVFVVGPNFSMEKIPELKTRGAQMDIDLVGISKNDRNGGHAAVTFISYTNMSNSSVFMSTINPMMSIMSSVVSATLSKTNNTILTKPVNFTLKHMAELNPNATLSCVYWKEKEWVTDGCTLTKTNSSHTVCSCTHLSTFALIMQTHPQKTEAVLELINMMAVIVGLVCLSLALLTFFLCRRNSRVTKTTRVNLCICLLLAHLLFLLTQALLQYIQPHQVVCAVLAGVLHFLFLSAFVWMSIEAVLLFISVKNLSSLNQKNMLGWKRLTGVGYGIPLVVVAVSAGVMPGGYGSEKCWLKNDRNLVWSFLGPVCFMLVSNVILFSLIANSLRSSLARLNSQVSQINHFRIVVLKTVVQFFILGCPWILGFFTNSSKVLEILFLFLNSQQGTFIFLIHCILNKEVRQEYQKLLCGFQPVLTATTMTEVPNTRGGNVN